MRPLEWFKVLYPGAEAGWITLSYKRDAATRQDLNDPFLTEWVHVSALDRAGQRAEALADEYNVYFGVGLRRERLADGQRGTSQDVGTLPGLWVEVDCATGVHASGKAYFPSKQDARAFLDALPHRPSAIVDSGGGLHAYWLFRELWEFEADERDYAAALLRGWQGFIRSRAEAAGYAVDYTHDLARVLRPAGTWNRKNGRPVPVQPLWTDGPRYNPSDFEEFAEYESPQVRDTLQAFTLRADAQPPALKFAALRENDRRFRDTWDGRRKDLKDSSPSGVCMALASIAATAGWTDQEIADLLAAWRAQAGAKTKPAGWYALTLGKARQTQLAPAQSRAAAERLEEAAEPDEMLAVLSEMVGFRVLRLVRFFVLDPSGATTDPSYMLYTEAGAVRFDSADELLSRTIFRNRIAGHLQRYVEISAKDWPAVAKALLAVAVTVEAPIETSEYEQVRQHIAEYLEHMGVCEDPVHAYDGHMALQMDGALWFSLSRFAEWCRIRKGVRAGFRNLPTLLTAIGSRKRVMDNLLRGGKRAKLVFWSAP